MAVRIVRLKSGEEIITDYRVEDGMAILKNPAVLIPTGQGQIGFMPWMMYAELDNNTIKFDVDHVLFDVMPVSELMNQYNQTLGSGLLVPDKKVASLKISD